MDVYKKLQELNSIRKGLANLRKLEGYNINYAIEELEGDFYKLHAEIQAYMRDLKDILDYEIEVMTCDKVSITIRKKVTNVLILCYNNIVERENNDSGAFKNLRRNQQRYRL